MKHLEIEIKDKNGSYIGGWIRVESIKDIKDCLYWRFNDSYIELALTYLKYYNFDAASSDEDYFKSWLSSLVNNKECLFKLENRKLKYSETAYIVEVDR